MTPPNPIEEEIRRQMMAQGTEAHTGSAPVQPPPPERQYSVNPAKKNHKKGGLAGIGAALMALWAKLKFLLIGLKFLTFGKLLLTGGSMLVSAWVYAQRFGWPFGVGIVALIFIHECGHALAARLRGRGTGIMVFVPFMGAFVTTKRYGRNITEDAFIGIMGPIVGSLASAACIIPFFVTGEPFWLALAAWGFLINLFNLIPTPPLDGGWITPLFSPKLLAIGAVLLLFVAFFNPLILVLAFLSIPRIISAWKANPQTQPYYRATSGDRWRYGTAYLGLALFLALGQYVLNQYLNTGILPFA